MSTPCQVVMIPGPPGDDGDPGNDGANGANAYAVLLAGFVMPAIAGIVTAEVTTTAWMVPAEGSVNGQALAIQFAGTLLVAAIVDATHVDLYNPGYDGNAIAGVAIPNGSRVGVSGLEGQIGTSPGDALLAGNNLNDVVDAAASRANLALQGMAQQDPGAVAISGGSIAGIVDLAVADGGTGASNAAGARANLGAAATGLATASGLTASATDVVIGRSTAGAGAVEEIACTAFGRSLIAAASAAAASTILGGPTLFVVTKIAYYLATVADDVILVDATGGAVTIELPPVATATGKQLAIKKIDVSGNVVTVDASGGDLIDGAATQPLVAQWDSIDIVCDGSAWYVI